MNPNLVPACASWLSSDMQNATLLMFTQENENRFFKQEGI